MTHPRLASVRAELDAACRAAGRDPAEVGLIAVSKVHPIEAIDAVHAAGQVDFGESYAQELRDKAAVRPDLRWHFIGRIQTNKAKYIAPVAHRVHALETVKQAAKKEQAEQERAEKRTHDKKKRHADNVLSKTASAVSCLNKTLECPESMTLSDDVRKMFMQCVVVVFMQSG